MKHLFPDNFLVAIGGLSLKVSPAPPRAAPGVHLSGRAGQSLDFRDYQAYTSGDDLRRVDWNVYSRTRHLFVRRFERPTAVPVYVIVDASGSMLLEEPSRYAMAARLAAGVASAALAGQNPVFVIVADRLGTGVPRAVTSRRGLVGVLADLAADRTGGGSGVVDALAAVAPFLAAKGPGVLVILSDFFEPRGVDVLIDALRVMPHRLVLGRVTQPWDAEPELAGDFELQDCEADTRLTVSADAAVLTRYRTAYQDYFGRLDAFAAASGTRQAIVDASSDTVPQLERLFPGGVMTL